MEKDINVILKISNQESLSQIEYGINLILSYTFYASIYTLSFFKLFIIRKKLKLKFFLLFFLWI